MFSSPFAFVVATAVGLLSRDTWWPGLNVHGPLARSLNGPLRNLVSLLLSLPELSVSNVLVDGASCLSTGVMEAVGLHAIEPVVVVTELGMAVFVLSSSSLTAAPLRERWRTILVCKPTTPANHWNRKTFHIKLRPNILESLTGKFLIHGNEMVLYRLSNY